MVKTILAVIFTLLFGLSAAFLGLIDPWLSVFGIIVTITTMGGFILHSLEKIANPKPQKPKKSY